MQITLNDFEYVRKLIHDRAAIALEPGKQYLVESRLTPLAKKEGFLTLKELMAQVRSTPKNGLHRKVIEAMTTNETLFFRDFNPFETLRKHVIPDLIAKRAADRQLNIWSAACSTGQEPYSIAMLLREHFPSLSGWKIRILATDLSSDVLERARAARYSQVEVARGLPTHYLASHFTKQGADWQLCEEIQKMVVFRHMNLAESWPKMSSLDIVFLRNVMIYFDVETRKTILHKMRRILRPDGYLFLGAAETTYNLDDAFQSSQIEKSMCFRVKPAV